MFKYAKLRTRDVSKKWKKHASDFLGRYPVMGIRWWWVWQIIATYEEMNKKEIGSKGIFCMHFLSATFSSATSSFPLVKLY